MVIPLFQEERRITRGFEGLAQLSDLLGGRPEVLLVDDGSRDRTLALARGLAHPGDRVLAEPHRGKGGAVRAGALAARGRRVLVTDVDWSVPPTQVPLLLASPADLVLAVREGPGAVRVGEPPWRHLLGRAFNALVQATVLAGHEDTQCGCKLFRADAVPRLFAPLQTLGWSWDVEIIARAHREGLHVSEVPVAWRYEADTRLRPRRDAVAMAREVWRIRRLLVP